MWSVWDMQPAELCSWCSTPRAPYTSLQKNDWSFTHTHRHTHKHTKTHKQTNIEKSVIISKLNIFCVYISDITTLISFVCMMMLAAPPTTIWKKTNISLWYHLVDERENHYRSVVRFFFSSRGQTRGWWVLRDEQYIRRVFRLQTLFRIYFLEKFEYETHRNYSFCFVSNVQFETFEGLSCTSFSILIAVLSFSFSSFLKIWVLLQWLQPFSFFTIFVLLFLDSFLLNRLFLRVP